MHELSSRARTWLAQDVIPLWFHVGVDSDSGAFFEALSPSGEPLPVARRAMVQARQIYAVTEAWRMGLVPEVEAKRIVRGAVKFLLRAHSLPNGAFVHSVDRNERPVVAHCDLYAQGFALFGLAEAYRLLREPELKSRALTLIEYLNRERRLPEGGFSEVTGSEHGYEANPHMHLFEAAIAWMQADTDTKWSEFAGILAGLCRERFVDPQSGGLCEHFAPGWVPQTSAQGFVWEPGHHYEWAWLLVQYQQVSGRDMGALPGQLYAKAETEGRHPQTGFVFDEMWSRGGMKKSSSRFWPQGERVKAAAALGALAQPTAKPAFARAADEALNHLFAYFEGPKPGLWHDTRLESGVFNPETQVKASSLYHIINAISEYMRWRPKV